MTLDSVHPAAEQTPAKPGEHFGQQARGDADRGLRLEIRLGILAGWSGMNRHRSTVRRGVREHRHGV